MKIHSIIQANSNFPKSGDLHFPCKTAADARTTFIHFSFFYISSLSAIPTLDTLKTFFSRRKSVAAGMFAFFSQSAMPFMTETEYLKAYLGWTYACTSAIAECLADIDLHLQTKAKDSTWQNIEEHEALTLLHYVSSFLSYSELLFATQAFLELDGNTFWYLVRNGKGAPSEIWVLNPVRVSVVKSKTDSISGYVYLNPVGEKIPLDPTEIIHFKTFHPLDRYRGIGTVQAAVAIDTDTFAGSLFPGNCHLD